MGDGEMVATNSTIDLNPHGEMVWWLNGAMVEWWNGEITIDKWRYGETRRNKLFTIKLIYLPALTQILPALIS